MSEWLQFIMGAVDLDDLPLNISRRTLNQNKSLRVIKKILAKNSIDVFINLVENGSRLKFPPSHEEIVTEASEQCTHSMSNQWIRITCAFWG